MTLKGVIGIQSEEIRRRFVTHKHVRLYLPFPEHTSKGVFEMTAVA